MDTTIRRERGTIILAAANILIWIILEFTGNTEDAQFMYSRGAMSSYGVLVDHEYWRFLSSIFLHFGPQHLINNILLLVVAGSYLEPAIGTVRFMIVYFFAGIVGSFVSCLYMVYKATWGVSAGASGAIFGIVGGLLFMIIASKGSFSGIRLRGMLLAVALMLFAGISSAGVDNAAHIGGFVGGFIATAIILLFGSKGERRIED